jgi:BsuBI/PstI restriction endonuclease domain
MRTPTTAGHRSRNRSGRVVSAEAQRPVAFVTADLDRSHAVFKKTIPDVAWRSYACLAAEPEHIVVLHDGGGLAPATRATHGWLEPVPRRHTCRNKDRIPELCAIDTGG